MFIDNVTRTPGTFVVLGSNLATHFNLDIVKLAEDDDSHFVMLLPNATHLLQTLDIAVSSFIKESW